MPRPLSPLPEPLRHDAFRYDESIPHNVSRRLLRREDLVSHPHRGVYTVPAGDDVVARLRALLPVLGPDQWVSHLSAARVYGMPMPFAYRGDEPLHVTAIGGPDRVRRPGITGWKTAEATLARSVVDGMPLIAPADVWAQLSVPGGTGIDDATGRRWSLPADWLVAVGDYLVTGPGRGQRRTALCSLADLEAAASRRRGRRGAKALAAAIPRIREGVHSPEETLLRLGLVAHGLPEPIPQIPVMTRAGLRHADLGYRTRHPERLLLLEYQGDQHRTDREQWLADLTRVQLLQDAGHRTLLVGYADLHPSMSALAARVRRALRE